MRLFRAMGKRVYLQIVLGILILSILYLSSLHSYLLFHTISELFSIVIAYSVFIVAWNSRRFLRNHFVLFLGIAYLFIAILDSGHTMAYKGMGIFPGITTNPGAQIWIAARYMESISFLIAPLFLVKRIREYLVIFIYALISFIILSSIFYWKIFPSCFIEGFGLTTFKKISEYVISLIILSGCVHLVFQRHQIDKDVFIFVLVSMILTIFSELSFSAYDHAYHFFNLIGHFFKILSFYFVYRAFIYTGLQKPYSFLFKELKESEKLFQKLNNTLDTQIKERTEELIKTNKKLLDEITERKKLMKALTESENKYSTLVEESLVGVYILQDEKFVFANDRAALIYGYDKEEILNKNYLSFVHADDKEQVSRIHRQRLDGDIEAPSEYLARGVRKDGGVLWILRRNKAIQYNGRLAIMGNILNVTKRIEIENSLRESEKNLRFLSSQLISTEEKVRKNIAREIHDGIGQYMTAIKFSLESTINLLGEENIEESKIKPLKDAVSFIMKTIDEVRKIVMDLRPSTLDDLGLLPTLSWFSREFNKVYDTINIESHINIKENHISEPLKTVIYRVLQEAVNNIVKHSEASSIHLYLERKNGGIEMTIQDNGKGFDVLAKNSEEKSKKGFGLVSMRERTELSGGRFSIASNKGKGTKVTAIWKV